MDPREVKRLEARIAEAVQMLLDAGDDTYLCGLDKDAFLKALENELRFLGLHRHDDTAAQAVVRTYLVRHLEDWRKVLQERMGDASHR
jgi:hypothetical protein